MHNGNQAVACSIFQLKNYSNVNVFQELISNKFSTKNYSNAKKCDKFEMH